MHHIIFIYSFQSQNGLILTFPIAQMYLCFLSFQSQNGLILTNPESVRCYGNIVFQSQNGLILTDYRIRHISYTLTISIPKWSDFNCNYLEKETYYTGISIPKWSDFNAELEGFDSVGELNFNPKMV